jgi:hypothetical protein
MDTPETDDSKAGVRPEEPTVKVVSTVLASAVTSLGIDKAASGGGRCEQGGSEGATPGFFREESIVADDVELIMRFQPVAGEDVTVLTADFTAPDKALEAIARALDDRRSLVLTRARYNREAKESAVVINLANVVSVRVATNDSDTTGQYL